MGAPACHRRRPAQSLAPARTPPRVHPTRAEVGDKRGWPHPLVAPIRACLDDLLMSIAPGLFRRHRGALPAVPYACTSLPPAEPTGFHIQLAAQILVFASFENQSAPSPLCTNLHARRRRNFRPATTQDARVRRPAVDAPGDSQLRDSTRDSLESGVCPCPQRAAPFRRTTRPSTLDGLRVCDQLEVNRL
jgi:hypothetical protein